jgi:hypothetical protein
MATKQPALRYYKKKPGLGKASSSAFEDDTSNASTSASQKRISAMSIRRDKASDDKATARTKDKSTGSAKHVDESLFGSNISRKGTRTGSVNARQTKGKQSFHSTTIATSVHPTNNQD